MQFRWVKVQVPWKDLEGTRGARHFNDDVINDLSAGGLKILASIVKAPNWARNPAYGFAEEGPPQDPQDYANFVRDYAAHFCGKVQAIEVWNEQNLAREWGHEPLDAGRYIQLLSAAYHAIKGACPQIVVVSGALTPTGAPPPNAIDDFTYLEQMYQAGLKNVSDAIGAHPSGYNVSPDITWDQACAFISQQGSKFRGPCDSPHHSWSFRSTMEGYRAIMVKYGDGGKQIWPTEFGWASGGVGDPSYAYADDNTLEEQASWTARAYQLMKSWGYVGTAFLWNLNFTAGEQSQWRIIGRSAYDRLRDMQK